MNRTEYTEAVLRIQAHDEALPNEHSGAVQVGVLLVDLLRSRAQWTHDAVVDLFSGKHGPAVAGFAICAAQHGCSDYTTCDESPVVRPARPFAFWCASLGRVATLRAVLALDFAFARAEPGFGATTKSGRSLDQLSSVSWPDASAPPLAFTFLTMVGDKQMEWSRDTVSHCLDLLIELDPDHENISKAAGTEFGALVTEAAMRVRIRHASATSSAPLSQSTESPRRRSLAL